MVPDDSNVYKPFNTIADAAAGLEKILQGHEGEQILVVRQSVSKEPVMRFSGSYAPRPKEMTFSVVNTYFDLGVLDSCEVNRSENAVAIQTKAHASAFYNPNSKPLFSFSNPWELEEGPISIRYPDLFYLGMELPLSEPSLLFRHEVEPVTKKCMSIYLGDAVSGFFNSERILQFLYIDAFDLSRKSGADLFGTTKMPDGFMRFLRDEQVKVLDGLQHAVGAYLTLGYSGLANKFSHSHQKAHGEFLFFISKYISDYLAAARRLGLDNEHAGPFELPSGIVLPSKVYIEYADKLVSSTPTGS